MQTTQAPGIADPQSPKRAKSFALKAVLVAVAVAWLGLVAATWADAAEVTDADLDPGTAAAAAPARDPASSSGAAGPGGRRPAADSDAGYDFNWLDPEKRIYVLQNRRYLKANHLLVSAMVGTGFSNPYRTTYNLDPRLAYYFTESWGVEGFFSLTANKENSIFDALVGSAGNTRPIVREIRTQAGGLVHWVPWYAKINVFNQILYFDWYLSGGVGTMGTRLDKVDRATGVKSLVDESVFAFYLGTGHQYHLSQSFVVRLDFMSGIYNASIGDAAGTKAWFSNHNFALGLGLKL